MEGLIKVVRAKINRKAATNRKAEVHRVNRTSQNREVLRVNLTSQNRAEVRAEVILRLNLPLAEVPTLRQKVREVPEVQAAEVQVVQAEAQAEAEDNLNLR